MEVLVATGLGMLVFAAIMSLTLFGTRSTMAIANYSDLDSKSRYALDVIGRELRQATTVTGLQTTSTNTVLTLTNATAATVDVLTYDTNKRTITLARTGQPNLVALTECDRFDVNLFQRTPLVTATNITFYPATNTSGVLTLSLCKLVSLDWKCSRQILAQKVNTESVQAAEFVLRNKQ